MPHIGIVGARKYRCQKSVKQLVLSLSEESTIVTSNCKGVCSWSQHYARSRKMEVLVYSPDLTNIRSKFDVAERYYQRNKELVEKCDLIHAFLSAADGYAGGTKYEIEYAIKIGVPVKVHHEKGKDEVFHQFTIPFGGMRESLLPNWKGFFVDTFA
jgi:hypothetical protein